MASRKTREQKTRKAQFQQSLLQEEDRPTCLMEPQVQVSLPPRNTRMKTPRSTVVPALPSQGAGEDGAGARRKTTKLQISTEQPRMREMVRMRDRQRELSGKTDSKGDVPQALQYAVGLETSSDSDDKKKEKKEMMEEEMGEMEGEAEESSEEEMEVSAVQQILKAIDNMTKKMSTMEHRLEIRLNGIEDEIKGIKQDMRRQTNIVNTVKAKVQGIEKEVKEHYEEMVDYKDRVDKVEDSFTGWEQQRDELLQKLDVLDNQSRRNNIKIVGLPENFEEYDTTEFFQKWIPEILGLENFQYGLELERAHRVGRGKPYAGQRPRPVLVKCLRYPDKEKVLRLAIQNARLKNGPLMIQGNRVFFYPDLSSVVVKKRREFNPAKAILWNKGYKFSFRYPAVLRVQSAENQFSLFADCQQALQHANFLPNLKKDQDLMEHQQVQDISPSQVSLPSTSGKEEEVEIQIEEEQVDKDLEEAK